MRKRRDDIHTTPDVTHIHNPQVAHEVSDVNIKSILQFAFWLLVIGIVVHVSMWVLLRYFESREVQRESKSPPGPMALTQKERLPVEPRLQLAPGFGDGLSLDGGKNLELRPPDTEYKILNLRWREMLDRGERDSVTGAIKSLPIDEAIRQLVQQGLPARPGPNGQKLYRQAMEVPAYSSAGRTMEVRRQ